jgi:hypothetical protein
MKHKVSNLFSMFCLAAIAVVSAGGQVNVSGQVKDAAKTDAPFNSITRAEIEMLIANAAESKPSILKALAEDPEMKRQQIEQLKQLLALASQAQKEGMAADPTNRQELDNIRAEILAVNYDKMLNKGRGPMPPFGYVTAAQVAKYWSENGHEPEFVRFLDSKVKLLGAAAPERTISAEEEAQARDVFARTQIYLAEYESKLKSGTLAKEFVDNAALQVKLQQAQFLAKLYSQKIADQTKATDAEIAAYFTAHPEIDPARKRAEAQGILDRAKAGENFAALANKFSEDPGNIGPNGVLAGGIYKDVPKGRMVSSFEAAALALQAGQVGPELVRTDHGYHIIKLERQLGKKRVSDEATYDVRHILISTDIEDPEDPSGSAKPAEDFVRNKLENAKEQALIAKLVLDNKIQVPDNFTVPKPAADPVRKPATTRPPVRNK